MKEVLSWIVEHYELIILVGACLLDIVLFLFGVCKKKGDSAFDMVVREIPVFIALAEKKFGSGNGEKKLHSVLFTCLSLYNDLTGVDLTPESAMAKQFINLIEKVLETPQKKGN